MKILSIIKIKLRFFEKKNKIVPLWTLLFVQRKVFKIFCQVIVDEKILCIGVIP